MQKYIKYSEEYKKEINKKVKTDGFSILFLTVVLVKNIIKDNFDMIFKVELVLVILSIINIINIFISMYKAKSKNFITIDEECIEINRNIISNKKIAIKDFKQIREEKDELIISYKEDMEYVIKSNKISMEDINVLKEINSI